MRTNALSVAIALGATAMSGGLGVQPSARAGQARSVLAEDERFSDSKLSTSRGLTCRDRWGAVAETNVERVRESASLRLGVRLGLNAEIREHADPCLPMRPIVEPVESLLDDVVRLQRLGRMEEAEDIAQRALDQAATLGSPCGSASLGSSRDSSSELAAAEIRLAEVHIDSGEAKHALEALFRAQLHAIVCHDDTRYALSRLRSAEILITEFGDVDRATVALGDAIAQIDQLGAPRESMLRHEQWRLAGLIAEAEGDHAGARSSYQASMDALEDPARHPLKAARISAAMGRVLRRIGGDSEAVIMGRQAKEMIIAALGVEHPLVQDFAARLELDIALIRSDEGNHREALEHINEAVGAGLPRTELEARAAQIRSEHALGHDGRVAQFAEGIMEYLGMNEDIPVRTLAKTTSALGMTLANGNPEEAMKWLRQSIRYWSAAEEPSREVRDRLRLARVLYEQSFARESFDQIKIVLQNLDALSPEDVSSARRLGGEIAVMHSNLEIAES